MSGGSGERPPLVACSSSSKRKKKKLRMSAVSTRGGMQLVPCSSSSAQDGKEEKQVIIYYPGRDSSETQGTLVCVPIDHLIPNVVPDCTTFELELQPSPQVGEFPCFMSCICTPATTSAVGPRLYLFGGLEPPHTPFRLDHLQKGYVSKKAYHCGLKKLPAKETGPIVACDGMISAMSNPLLAQVGDDCIYILGFGKTTQEDYVNDDVNPAFQKYNFKENKWTLLNNDSFDDMVNRCHGDYWVADNLNLVPHVVIDQKLHVSIGFSSFTYDTTNGVWEDSKLFKTFWSKQEKKSLRHFHGRRFWDGNRAAKKKKRKWKNVGGGPPFGFFGRGIIWDKNILLAVQHAPNSSLVAFLLDDETGRVVRSQALSLGKDLVLDAFESLREWGHLVDLGRDGYFGLVHTVLDTTKICSVWEQTVYLEVVVFKVSKRPPVPPAQEIDDDGEFLECHFVGKTTVAKDLSPCVGKILEAFCV